MAAIIECPKCKEPVTPDAHSCPHCGTQLQTQGQKSGLTPSELTQPLPDVVKQIDAYATTYSTIAGVLIAFYSAGIFAGNVQPGVGSPRSYAYALPVGLLLIATVLAISVFYPNSLPTDADDYHTLIDKKKKRLHVSSIFLVIAIGSVFISVFVYLLA